MTLLICVIRHVKIFHHHRRIKTSCYKKMVQIFHVFHLLAERQSSVTSCSATQLIALIDSAVGPMRGTTLLCRWTRSLFGLIINIPMSAKKKKRRRRRLGIISSSSRHLRVITRLFVTPIDNLSLIQGRSLRCSGAY